MSIVAQVDYEGGCVMQLHLGAVRNVNTRMLRHLGQDTVFDSIGDYPQGVGLARFLDSLDRSDKLHKTILYNLNRADNELNATITGNFQDGSVPGKMQYASAWWFVDQKDAMEREIRALFNYVLIFDLGATVLTIQRSLQS